MKKGRLLPTIVTYLFLAILIIYFLNKGNFEFLGYAAVVGILYWFVLKLDSKYNLPTYTIWLFVVWVFLHMLGGTIYIIYTRLYDLILIDLVNKGGEFVILKYDQFVHAFCYFAFSIIIYYILKSHMKPNNKIPLAIFAILASVGVGMLNEVIEFGMVLFAGAADAVGGYYNTALDLVFNLIGAIIGVWFVSSRE